MRSSLVALLLVAAAAVACAQSPRPSQRQEITQQVGATDIHVTYIRPVARGRTLFGSLVPYRRVWTPSADSAMQISFSTDVDVAGKPLSAGSYSVWTIPDSTQWTVIFNKQATGSPADYSAEKDVLRVKVKPQERPMRELFTIAFPEVTTNSAELALVWEKVAVVVNLAVDTNALFLANAKEAVSKAKPDDWRTPLTAARYLYDNKYAPADAAAFLDKSLSIKETFANLSTKANVLAGEGKKKEAVATAQKALAMKDTEPKPAPEAVADLEKKIAEWKTAK